jgi:hypothetical protein
VALRAECGRACLFLFLLLLGCGRADTTNSPGALAASAPPQHVDARVVGQLAQALSVPPERARELATEDALLAAELARQEPALADSIERLVLARSLARELLDDAERGGPATDAEVEQLTAERWWELDRPRMVQVSHAVVLSDTENMEAEALAERLAQAVASATNAKEFDAAARNVPAGSYEVKVESLPPMTLDGRAIDPDRAPPLGPPPRQMVPEFSTAAAALTQVGQFSPVVHTPFGYHVLMAIRILEPRQPSLAERRELLRPQVLQRRALAAQSQLLERQRQEARPEQLRTARRSVSRLAVAP